MRNYTHTFSIKYLFFLTAFIASSCNYIDKYSPHFDLEQHEEKVNGHTIEFLLPPEYTKNLREVRTESGMFGDKTFMMDDSCIIYFSDKELRSFFSIQTFNFNNDFDSHWYSVLMKESPEYLDSILTKEQLKNDKCFNYRMPLVQKKKDKHGHPTTTTQYITRYADSHPDALFLLNYETENVQDSVEAIFDFYTIIGTNIIECYFYSLDSYDNFSYERFLSILESISVCKNDDYDAME